MPNISRRKGNQAITFGQLIEYNKRNMFLEKSPTKCLGVASPKPFHIKSKFGISLKRQSEMFYGLFLLYVQVVVYQNILKLKCWPLAFTLNKFKKKKKGKKEVWIYLPTIIFCMIFEGKYFSRFTLLTG